jgi:acyl-CoA thioesterase YciA
MTDANALDCSDPAIRVMMMPRDTNAHGTIFGGVILSYLDQAGAIEARRHGPHSYVSVAMDQVVFKQPVFVGDVLSFCADTVSLGRTSIKVRVTVWADRWRPPRARVRVTQAELVYVAVGEDRRPVPIRGISDNSPP